MNIIITGGSKGIGKELVLKFAENPSNFVITISRSVESVVEFKSLNNVIAFNFDYNTDDYNRLIEFCNETLNHKIDILINNAGLLFNKTIFEISDEEIFKTYNVNLFSVMKLVKGFINSISARQGHILNISSMGGVQGSVKFPGLSIYSSAKAALICLTEALAVELAEKSIAVNALALGAVQTEMLQTAFPDYKAPVSAIDMAEFIYYFAVEGKKFFNGKVLPVSLSTP